MGKAAFTNYLFSIQTLIGANVDTVKSLERKIQALNTGIQGGINIQQSLAKLAELEADVAKLSAKTAVLQDFFVDIKRRFSKARDRVIGFVRWSPPIGTGVPPHRYTRDVCVIELYKEKFKHLMGNVLSLGAMLFFSLNAADLKFSGSSRSGDVSFETQRSPRRPIGIQVS